MCYAQDMNVYLSGIGGVGIGPLAQICVDAGFNVSGSDMQNSFFTTTLQKAGADIAITSNDSHIAEVHSKSPIDWLVISSAIPSDHPEVVFAKAAGIKISKRAEMINFILQSKDLKMLAVSGTHGKTTTSAMLVWLFKSFDIPNSYCVGTNLSFGQSGAYQQKSQFFIYECDEYDRNMLEFHPYCSIITNVDYDHPDTYSTQREYTEAFRKFANQSQSVLTWQDTYDELRVQHPNAIILKKSDPSITDIALPGLHNRQNAWQVARLFNNLFSQFTIDDILSKLALFPGTGRRFEKIADNLYSDYAHHPAEVKAVLQLAREINSDIVAIYQPHQNTRQHRIIDQYQDSFALAKKVYWLPTYLSREDKSLDILSPVNLISKLSNPKIAEAAELNATLLQKIKEHLSKNELVILLSAGNADEWLRENFKS